MSKKFYKNLAVIGISCFVLAGCSSNNIHSNMPTSATAPEVPMTEAEPSIAPTRYEQETEANDDINAETSAPSLPLDNTSDMKKNVIDEKLDLTIKNVNSTHNALTECTAQELKGKIKKNPVLGSYSIHSKLDFHFSVNPDNYFSSFLPENTEMDNTFGTKIITEVNNKNMHGIFSANYDGGERNVLDTDYISEFYQVDGINYIKENGSDSWAEISDSESVVLSNILCKVVSEYTAFTNNAIVELDEENNLYVVIDTFDNVFLSSPEWLKLPSFGHSMELSENRQEAAEELKQIFGNSEIAYYYDDQYRLVGINVVNATYNPGFLYEDADIEVPKTPMVDIGARTVIKHVIPKTIKMSYDLFNVNFDFKMAVHDLNGDINIDLPSEIK